LLFFFLLAACGGDQSSPGESADVGAMDDAAMDAAVEYQKKVSAKVGDSMVKSFVRDFGITEEQARCLLEEIGLTDLMRAETDPEVQDQIRECDVDPEVVR
jgi:hypothetical protein